MNTAALHLTRVIAIIFGVAVVGNVMFVGMGAAQFLFGAN